MFPSLALRMTFAPTMLALCVAAACDQTPASDVPPTPTAAASTATSTPTPAPDPTPTPPPTIKPTSTPIPRAAPTTEPTPRPTPRVIRSTSQESQQPAPDFTLETFDGESVRLSDLRGQVVVLNFWASWCPPCRWEMPFFEDISQQYSGDGVTFVGVAMSDTVDAAREFADTASVTYPVGLDATNEITRAYRVVTLPTTFFISPDGNIQRKLTSPANEGALHVFIRGQLPRAQGE